MTLYEVNLLRYRHVMSVGNVVLLERAELEFICVDVGECKVQVCA
jgi:hypothetical protein